MRSGVYVSKFSVEVMMNISSVFTGSNLSKMVAAKRSAIARRPWIVFEI